MRCLPHLPLLLLQLLLPVVVVVPGKGEPVDPMSSDTSLPFLQLDAEEEDPSPWAGNTALANTSIVAQQVLMVSDGDGGTSSSSSSQDQSPDNSSSGTMPTAQPLIQKWNRVQHIFPMRPVNRYHLSNSRKDFLPRNYQNVMRGGGAAQYPLRQSPNSRRHLSNTQDQEQTMIEHSYSQNQKNNPSHNPPAQHREDTYEVSFRSPSGSPGGQFYPPQVTQKYVPRPDPFSRSQQFPRQSQGHPKVQQKVYRLLPDEQSERYLKEPGPEISVHDLTSAFYTARELLSSSSVVQTSSTRNTDRSQPSEESERSFDTNNKRPSLTPQYDPSHPRATLESYYPTRRQETLRHTTQRVYDPSRYPPSVNYGEPFFDQQQQRRPLRIIPNLHESDHSRRKKVNHTPPSYNGDGQQTAQPSPSNMYNSDSNRRQFSLYHYLANQNLEDPVYRNQKLNYRKNTTGLNYAKLPSGYESPTTTFEELNGGKGGNTNDGRKKTRFDIKKHQPSVRVNGHGRPHLGR